ncbi:AprI/Inh family metalloprotease inhibitor [Acuticoccus mangrovi]|uniref:AprI/Inh family metalloprotease inhibitor n=1 Tax=Acuticoccus mangrovi TaxID=2796142 RepID=A0A934MG53_9HYPH|nr:AprI/Inh family metalloprotease inhibitor [Acuticoccus mangrovi]MBJ3776188.1 AprI/Inh family metalloprotease inhibitor [Acuticoccus mangrovi]
MIAFATTRRVGQGVLLAALTLALAGCFGGGRKAPQPLRPAPSQPVQRADLAPPPVQEQPEAPISEEPLPDETPEEPAQVAAVTPTTGIEIGRTDLLGGWTLTSGGETCQLFMSLTTWTGGYRASTRGCSSPQLSGISAWDLSGRTVTLKGGDTASPVATLAASEASRFNGSTVDGAAITVSR